MPTPTRRELITQTLRGAPMTPRQLAAALDMRVRDVLADLPHVRRSLGRDLRVTPARCSRCDFTFTRRRRLSTPSRCPDCRTERIDGPWLQVRERG